MSEMAKGRIVRWPAHVTAPKFKACSWKTSLFFKQGKHSGIKTFKKGKETSVRIESSRCSIWNFLKVSCHRAIPVCLSLIGPVLFLLWPMQRKGKSCLCQALSHGSSPAAPLPSAGPCAPQGRLGRQPCHRAVHLPALTECGCGFSWAPSHGTGGDLIITSEIRSLTFCTYSSSWLRVMIFSHGISPLGARMENYLPFFFLNFGFNDPAVDWTFQQFLCASLFHMRIDESICRCFPLVILSFIDWFIR